MFSLAGRAVARRVPSAAAQLLSRPLVIRTALATRSFTVSSSDPYAAAKAASDKTPKTKKPSATKATKTPAAKKKAAANKKPKKAKPAAKAKKAPRKPAPKPKKEKEPLSPEQEKKEKLRRLKKVALLKDAPKTYKKSTWLIYCGERLNQMQGVAFGDALPTIKEDYTNLTASELRDLQATAESQNEAALDAEQKWIKSHPAEAVYLANIARRHIARLTEKHVKVLEDDRLPKQLISPYTRFVKDRLASLREETGVTVQEGLKKLGELWNQASAEERRPFEEEFAKEKQQYDAEAEAFYAKLKAYKAQQKQAEKEALAEKREKRNAVQRARTAERREANVAEQASSESGTYV